MNLKKTITTICAASAIISVTPPSCHLSDTSKQRDTKTQRPNFVNIVIDDMGFSDLGAFGGEIETPNLDKLAQQGTILSNFYASPTSTPSRGMLFTGKDMHQVGTGNLSGWANTRPPQNGLVNYSGNLSKEALPFSKLLQDNDYHTMMVGKWDLGSTKGFYPNDRGFEQSLVLLPGGDVHYITDDNGKIIRSRPPTKGSDDTPAARTSYNKNGKNFTDFPNNAYATDFYTTSVIEMLEKWKNTPSFKQQPFYLNVSHIAPHSPLQAPVNIIAKYEPLYAKGWDVIRKERFDRLKELGFVSPNAQLPQPKKKIKAWDSLSKDQQKIEAKRMATYAAMIHVMDQQVGRLIKHLKGIGEYDNTVFLVLSDNGGAFVPTGGPQSSRDYRNAHFTGDCSDDNADTSKIPKDFDKKCPKLSTGQEIITVEAKNMREVYENMGSSTSFINPDSGWGTVANTPFNRYKGDTFEGGIHTAAFVYYPKFPNQLKEAKKMDKCLRSIMDIAPTILEMANIKYPNSHKPMQGISMTDLFGASPKSCDKERWLAWEQDSVKGVRKGDWKLSQQWWETQSRWDPNWYLYNLADDPFEQNDLSKQRPDKLKEMEKLYEKYAQENGVIKVGSKILPELYRGEGKRGEDTLIMGGVAIDYNLYNAIAEVNPKDKVEIDSVIRPARQHIKKPGKVAVILVPCKEGYCKADGKYSSSDVRNYFVLTSEGVFERWKSQAGGIGDELPPYYKTYSALPDWIEISNKEVNTGPKSPFTGTTGTGEKYQAYEVMLGYWLDEEKKMIYNKEQPIRLTWNGNQPLLEQPKRATRDNVE